MVSLYNSWRVILHYGNGSLLLLATEIHESLPVLIICGLLE